MVTKNHKLSTEIKRQVDDVHLLVQSLLAKKLAELKEQNPDGKRPEQKENSSAGELYTSVNEALDNLKVELKNNPSNETVRQVKLMLADISKQFKAGLPTGVIKAILDMIYRFIPIVSYDYKYVKKVGVGNTKTLEVRRFISELLLKFVHDSSIKYLGSNSYPKYLSEANKYLGLDEIGESQMREEKQKEDKVLELQEDSKQKRMEEKCVQEVIKREQEAIQKAG